MRGYKIEIETDENDLKAQIRKEMIDKLAAEWNCLNSQIERNSWRSREMDDEYSDYHAEMAEEYINGALDEEERAKGSPLTPEEENVIKDSAGKEYDAKLRERENEPYIRLEVIEELLGELGARMMRPYEHWNEDERYMEYMENRYDYGDDY